MSKIEVNTVEPQCGTTLTLGASGDTVSLPSGVTLSGVGTVSWDTTAKTAGFTGVSGNGYFINTTSGAITVNLPASPSAGNIMAVADYAGTAGSNAITIGRNGSNIEGGTDDATLNVNRESKTFVYVDGTQGWLVVNSNDESTIPSAFLTATGGTITTSGNCKIHTFTGPGTFTVSSAGACATNNIISYLVVAGGGGAGNQVSGNGGVGGGGAGGFREAKSPATPYTASPLDGYPSAPNRITVSAQGYPITVGAGGATQPTGPGAKGNPGSNSIFSTITSAGGGGSGSSSSGNEPGLPGGSGGGASQTGSPPFSGGTGNTPPTTPAQGTNGGTTTAAAPNYSGSGGGGATVAGAGNASTAGGNGGAGATTSINATPTAYAGGGGGGVYQGGTPGTGGAGGGGAGGTPVANNAGTAGTANTGGGAGGASTDSTGTPVLGSAGGSGIVIIRYKFQ